MSFDEVFRANNAVFLLKDDLEFTGRVILPECSLSSLITIGMNSSSAMVFCIENMVTKQRVYAGVESFTNDPGILTAPFWLLNAIGVEHGGKVRVSLAQLPLATKAVFQPLDERFFRLSNPKRVLEESLKSHPCLTQGSVIPIKFCESEYRLNVFKLEPQPYVSIFKCDVVCEFASPESSYDHRWLDSDTDSSDDGTSPNIIVSRTLNGKMIKEPPKPQHSTYDSREQERKDKVGFNVRRFEDGKEIFPPKPKEKIPKKKESFSGKGKTLSMHK